MEEQKAYLEKFFTVYFFHAKYIFYVYNKDVGDSHPPDNFLNKIDILKLLGVINDPENVRIKILFESQKAVLENLFESIIPNVINEQDFNAFAAEMEAIELMNQNDAVSRLDVMIEGLFRKYPELLQIFVNSVNDYKVMLMKQRVEKFCEDKTFSSKECKKAMMLFDRQNWADLYDLIISKYA